MNIGIFGVGKLGETHIKGLKSIQEINIVGFFDPDKKRANDISKTPYKIIKQQKV